MLYVLHRGNHPELTYKGGQKPIVHLEADLHDTVAWTEGERRRWAFSLSNAGAFYAEFRNGLDNLREVDWTAVAARDFREAQIKEGKQAEFLVHEFFGWHLVERIGVSSAGIQDRVTSILDGAAHVPVVRRVPKWYF